MDAAAMNTVADACTAWLTTWPAAMLFGRPLVLEPSAPWTRYATRWGAPLPRPFEGEPWPRGGGGALRFAIGGPFEHPENAVMRTITLMRDDGSAGVLAAYLPLSLLVRFGFPEPTALLFVRFASPDAVPPPTPHAFMVWNERVPDAARIAGVHYRSVMGAVRPPVRRTVQE